MKKFTMLSISTLSMALMLTACGGISSTEVESTEKPAHQQPLKSGDDTSKATREPANKKVMGQLGETIESGDLKFTLDKVVRYENTDSISSDKEFILLWFTVNNTSSENYYIGYQFLNSYIDEIPAPPYLLITGAGIELWGYASANGEPRQGYVAYEVDKNWEKIEFQYGPDIYSNEEDLIKFTVQNTDVR